MLEILRKPKVLAFLGLIGSIISIIPMLISIFNFGDIIGILLGFQVGLIGYFLLIILRLYKIRININIPKVLLIIYFIINDIMYIIIAIKNIYFFLIVWLLLLVLYTFYFIHIFYNRGLKISNKVLLIATLVFIIIALLNLKIFSVITFDLIVIWIFILPYFYQYYNLLEEEKENG